jgi:hypothetical protein
MMQRERTDPEFRAKRNDRLRTRYHADPEAAREKMRRWREEHPEQQKAIERANWQRNRDKILARNLAAYHADKERRSEKRRQHYRANQEQADARRRQYHLDHAEGQNLKQRVRFQTSRVHIPWRALLYSAAYRAKKYNVPFSLTEEWAKARWTGFCEVSGLPFTLGKRTSGPKIYSPSLDQIVPRKGYTPDNCRFVIWAVNALKHDGTDADMLKIAHAIVANYVSNPPAADSQDEAVAAAAPSADATPSSKAKALPAIL